LKGIKKMTRYISVTDTAKLIRKELKKNFAGIKFSVTQRSGGLSICVEWLDGPSEPSVNKIVKRFQGASFDSSIDLQSYVDSIYEGEEVHFGANYVTCRRNKSRVFVEAIVAQFSQRWGYSAGQIKVVGSEQDAWLDSRMDYSEEHWLRELLYNTDQKDMHRAYEAEEEREQAERDEYVRNEPQRQKEAQAREEQAERECEEAIRRQQAKAQRERERQEQEQARAKREMPMERAPLFYSRQDALQFLGANVNATDEEIRKAFIAKVKYYADGRGGYGSANVKVDMDKLVKAKEKALQR
jgi:Large polyvalent protein associated domain 29